MTQDMTIARSLYEEAEQRREQGEYTTARALYEQALALYEQGVGRTHADTAQCLHGLALTLRDASDYEAAQRMAERALSIRQQVLGVTHPDAAASLHLLGEIRFDRGEMQAGIGLVEQALALRVEALGETHPDSIEGLMMVALMLAHKGQRERALPMLLRARTLCEAHLGEHHLVTARVLNGLGVLWARERATYADARAMYERSLAIYEQIRGPEHQDTARSLNNLATLLLDMGEVQAAQPLLERSLALHEQLLGPSHLGTAFVLMNLGDAEYRQHRYRVARPLYERALISCEKNFGASHPQTLRSLRKVVTVLGDLHQQGERDAMTVAMPLHTCLISLEAAAGMAAPPDPSSLFSPRLDPSRAAEELHRWVARLEAEQTPPERSAVEQEAVERARLRRQEAQSAYEQGDYQAAQALLEEALALQEQGLGENHLNHVDLLHELARAKRAGGQHSAVLPLMQRAVDIQRQLLGPHHPTTIAAMTSLIAEQTHEYGPQASLPLYSNLLQIMEEALGPENPLVEMARNSTQTLLSLLGGGEMPDQPLVSRSERREQALEMLPQERAALLAGLDDIDWHSLHHAYGSADDVPDLLRMLLSDDKAVREDAWEQLYSNVWHQGTVYEATAHVVPFLLRMLDAGGPPEPSELLYFLGSIAEGSSYLEVHATGEWEQTWREILAEQGKALEPQRDEELHWVVAANHAVGEGIPLYLELLEHEDDQVREAAFYVLSSLYTRAPEVVPPLLDLLEYELDDEFQAQVVRALRALMDDSAESQAFFASLLGEDESEEITFLAALALTERAREQTPELAVERLLDTLRALGTVPAQGWGEEESAVADAIAALACLGQARALPALLQAIPLIQEHDTAREAAGVLLDLLFNEGQVQGKSTAISWEGTWPNGRQTVDYWEPRPQPLRTAASLTESERAALRLLLAHEPLWMHDHNLLALYGLPAEREALGTFING